jgi:long-chain acyl-CoA synthetase
MPDRPWLRKYDAGVPHHIAIPPLGLPAFLGRSAQAYPSRTCLIFGHSRLSYHAVDRRTSQLAAGLLGLGLQPSEPIAILIPNLPSFVLAFYGILKAGGAVVALNPLYTLPELVRQLNQVGVRKLLTTSSLADRAQLLRSETSVEMVCVSDEAAYLPVQDPGGAGRPRGGGREERADGAVCMEDLIAAHPPLAARDWKAYPEAPAILQFSGGTTGTSKAAIGLHRNLVANTLQFRSWLVSLEDGRETMLLAIPLSHVYGMVVGMSVAIAMAARMVLIPNPRDLGSILDAIRRHRPTAYPGVPTMYNGLNSHPDVLSGKVRLRSIKACISGSAPLLRETKERFESLTGGKLVEGYGLSEAPTATHCNPLLGENRTGSIGLPLPDVECRLVSLQDGITDAAPGEAGELAIRSPNVMAGYHGQPEETAIALRDGWLFTGDIVRMDADGYFYIVDRKKDLIKPGGYQVWPREVEEVLAQHPGVQEVGVAGVPDAHLGEAVKAWIVLREGGSLTLEEVQAWCRERLAPFKIPQAVAFLASLPKSPAGKILRRELVRGRE